MRPRVNVDQVRYTSYYSHSRKREASKFATTRHDDSDGKDIAIGYS